MVAKRSFGPEVIAKAWKDVLETAKTPDPDREKASYFSDLLRTAFDQGFIDEPFIEEAGEFLDAQSLSGFHRILDENAGACIGVVDLPDGSQIPCFVETFIIPVAGRRRALEAMISGGHGGGSIPKSLVKSGFCGKRSMVLLSNRVFNPEMLMAFSPMDIYRMAGHVRQAFFERGEESAGLSKLKEEVEALAANCSESVMPPFGSEQVGSVYYLFGFSIRIMKASTEPSGLSKIRRGVDVRPNLAAWDELTEDLSNNYGMMFGTPAPWSEAAEALSATLFNHQLATLTHQYVEPENIKDVRVYCQFQPDGLHFSLYHNSQYLGEVGIPIEVIRHSIKEVLMTIEAVFNLTFLQPGDKLPRSKVH